MKKILPLLIIAIISCSNTSEKAQSSGFLDNYKTENINCFENCTFSYTKDSIIKLYNKPRAELFKNTNSPLDSDIILAEVNISPDSNFLIIFSPGPSADYSFRITNVKNPDQVFAEISSEKLYISGNGIIYSKGHVNNYFNMKRKYSFKNKTLKEIKQQFYYCGLKSVTEKEITLYKTDLMKERIALIPAGYNVEVVLMHGEDDGKFKDLRFLIKTDFGLTGWTYINYGPPLIKGIYFAGD